ncbi:FAD/NAD(P)-binding protein [Candidatus Binatia bacterium]|nr:FAD/NAD(P)-binding protein [Candidatus Binatia bacterium]
MTTPFALHAARIVERRLEAEDIHSFVTRFVDPEVRRKFTFAPGQFNMLYAYGVGEVPISIVSDPADPTRLEHTIRIAGRVTAVMTGWQVGDVIGIRGPYGKGWPLDSARGREVVIVTGGLGCAPVVGVINYIFRRREEFGTLHILHGVKTPNDLLYRERFDAWRLHPRTRVYLTADQPDKSWHYRVGVVTNLFDELVVSPTAVAMMCGPEAMMRAAIRSLRRKGIAEEAIFLSLERNMQCAFGLCGHCQLGPLFFCKDGPVFAYPQVKRWFGVSGI